MDTSIGKICVVRCIHEEDGKAWIQVSKKTHTNPLSRKETEILRRNPYIASVTANTVRFTEALKELAHEKKCQGVPVSETMRQCGIDPEILGASRVGGFAQATGCAIVLIGHLNKAAGTQSTYRGLGSIDITAAVRSLLFIGKLKDSPTTRVLIHEKNSLAPPGQSLAFSLGDEKGFEWIGAYDITADELLAGTDTAR